MIRPFVLTVALAATLLSTPLLAAPVLDPPIRVNDRVALDQRFPAVAHAADGGFIVVWEGEVQDGGDVDIFARRFDAAGVPRGDSIKVNSFTPNRQAFPAIAINSSGQFVVAWDSSGQDGPGINVYARRFNADGTPNGADIRINNGERDAQLRTTVALDETGNFVVAWPERQPAALIAAGPKTSTINGRRYAWSGVAFGDQFEIAKSLKNNLRIPSIAMAATGDFLVLWHVALDAASNLPQGAPAIMARRYSASAAAIGKAFQIDVSPNPNTELVDRPGVAMAPDGRFVVVWERLTPEYGPLGLFARRYDAGANALGAEFRIDANPSNLHYPAIAIDPQGNFTIAAHGGGIFVQRYSASGTAAGDLIRADVSDPDFALLPVIVSGDGGEVTLIWQDFGINGDGSGRGVAARLVHYP